jgi:hypothetical protein
MVVMDSCPSATRVYLQKQIGDTFQAVSQNPTLLSWKNSQYISRSSLIRVFEHDRFRADLALDTRLFLL